MIEHNPAKTGSDLHAATVDPLENGEWDSLLPPFPDATAFHTSAWARVLARTYGHKPLYLRFDRAGQPVALVPLMEVRSALTGRRGVCLPFTDCCAPLIDDSRFEDAIAAKLIEIAADRNWKYAELRGNARNGGVETTPLPKRGRSRFRTPARARAIVRSLKPAPAFAARSLPLGRAPAARR